MANFDPDAYLQDKPSSFDPDAYLGVAQQAPVNNLDVPAGGDAPAFPEQPVQPERSLGESIQGLGEAALTLGTGATGGALGFAGGTMEGIARNLAGDMTQEEAMNLAQQRASDYTYAPRGEAGQDIVGAIGETLSSLPPAGLTGGVTPKLGLPSARLTKSRNKVLNAMGEAAPEQVVKNFEKKLGNDRFEPRIFGMVKEARRQGFDDSFTTMVANSNSTNKRKYSAMVGKIIQGMGVV
jgi:hypothetical protein